MPPSFPASPERSTRPLPAGLWVLLSLICFVALWAVLSEWLDAEALPTPSEVWTAGQREWRLGYLDQMAATLARVAAAFAVSMLLGTGLGLALGMNPGLDRFFSSWLVFFLNLPALVTMTLVFIWLGLTEVAAIVAVAINKIPNVAATVREGARALSRDLAEMAAVYRMPWGARLRHVVLPQLAPYMAAAARNGLALVWKVVLFVELLGRPTGVGVAIYTNFQLFDVPAILAYALGFVAVILAVEYGVLAPWERAANRWRR